VIKITALMLDELREAGLLAEGLQLTEKGREWLHQLENLDSAQANEEWAADLVLSVNAISR